MSAAAEEKKPTSGISKPQSWLLLERSWSFCAGRTQQSAVRPLSLVPLFSRLCSLFSVCSLVAAYVHFAFFLHGDLCLCKIEIVKKSILQA